MGWAGRRFEEFQPSSLSSPPYPSSSVKSLAVPVPVMRTALNTAQRLAHIRTKQKPCLSVSMLPLLSSVLEVPSPTTCATYKKLQSARDTGDESSTILLSHPILVLLKPYLPDAPRTYSLRPAPRTHIACSDHNIACSASLPSSLFFARPATSATIPTSHQLTKHDRA